MFGWQKTCLSPRWLGYGVIFLQSLVCSLLVYALIIGGGDIVVSGCQKVGFYNHCLYNKTSNDCYCITQFEELHSAGETSPHGLVLAIILTYSPLVIVLMGILTLTFAQCFQESILWRFALGLNVLSLAALCIGMITYLFLTWNLFDISQVTPGFLALLLAVSGLSVLCCIIRRFASVMSKAEKKGNAGDDLS